jgi:hypothetical protein
MLVIETLKYKISHFLNSNTCFCSQLYGMFEEFRASKIDKKIITKTSFFVGNYVLMWKQQNRVLTAGTLVVRKDYRMRLKDDFSLELTQLKPDDQGTYTCEIDVMGKPISIKHKVSCIAGFIHCIIEWFCL